MTKNGSWLVMMLDILREPLSEVRYLKYTTPIGSAYAANIRVRRTDGSIDVVIIIFYDFGI